VAIAVGHSTLQISVNKVLDPTIPKKSGKEEFTRRLVAAAAAHISVLYRGRVSQMHLDFYPSKRSSRQCRTWSFVPFVVGLRILDFWGQISGVTYFFGNLEDIFPSHADSSWQIYEIF